MMDMKFKTIQGIDMSKRKAIRLQDDLESLIGKRGFIKRWRDNGHYVQVYIGQLTMEFYLGDTLTMEERKKYNKTCQISWKGTTSISGYGSAMSSWSKSTISQALIDALKIVTKR
tara:strand:+ start:1520 stop:1864 length:345 start_codon:yes stop_codon:yes gene_type:complete